MFTITTPHSTRHGYTDMDGISSDEYTALQKYISTYRDPKAADSPENQEKDAADAGKGKAWWQVCGSKLRLRDERVD
jgi:hypothetical protein